mgnify:CR=1 FL=1
MWGGFVFLYSFFAKDPYGKKKDAENNKVSCNCRPQTCRANMHRHDGNRSYHTRLPRLLLEFDEAEDTGYDYHKTDDNADNHTRVVGFAGCGKLLALGYVCNVKGDLVAFHLAALGQGSHLHAAAGGIIRAEEIGVDGIHLGKIIQVSKPKKGYYLAKSYIMC